MMLILVLAAAYVTLVALVTLGYGLLMRRTRNNVAAIWRAEEWRQSRMTRPSPVVGGTAGEPAGGLIGAGRRSG